MSFLVPARRDEEPAVVVFVAVKSRSVAEFTLSEAEGLGMTSL
jgi:hypothetical protein